MSIDPISIRSSVMLKSAPRAGSVDVLLEGWAYRAMEEQVNAQRVHHAVLLDHLRELLVKIGRSLAESESAASSQHAGTATQHGEQRWEVGWSLLEVVRDFQILRLVIVEFLDKNLGRPLHSREVLAIGLAVDEAISASVQRYVRSRDEYLLRLEKERSEEQRLAAMRLQEETEALQLADQRKNEFLAMLGHELRNPLAPIYQALQIFRLKSTTDPDVLRCQDVIRRQTELMTRMIDDLLDVSRITLGKMTIQDEMVEVSNIIATALETIRPLAQAKDQQLKLDIVADRLWLRGDRLRLSQVVINLLTNAVKYTPRSGTIWLTAGSADGEILIQVRDNGAGISSGLLPRIFEPFTQEEGASQGGQSGLGIGLAVVQKLVHLHDGSVVARSAGPGKGSEFSVRLPLVEKPVVAGDSSSSQSDGQDSRSSRNILVVDDNKDSADSLAMLLQLSDHKVEIAYDGPSALSKARSKVPDVVCRYRLAGHEWARSCPPGAPRIHQACFWWRSPATGKTRTANARKRRIDAHFVKLVAIEELTKLLTPPGSWRAVGAAKAETPTKKSHLEALAGHQGCTSSAGKSHAGD